MVGSRDDEDDDGEWKFSLSDLEDDDERGAADGDGRGATAGVDARPGGTSRADGESPRDGEGRDGVGEGVAGSFAPSERIEPGEIDPENALFVIVGVAIGLAVVGAYSVALL